MIGDIVGISDRKAEYMSDYSTLEEFLEGLEQGDTGAVRGLLLAYLGIVLAVAAVAAFIGVIVWLLRSVPLYLMAKRTGREHAWLAFVPVAWMYTLADIGKGSVTLFGKKIAEKRSNAFWIWLAVKYLGGTVASAISGVVGIFLSFVPFFGALLSMLVAFVLGLIPTVICCFIKYRFLCDALDVCNPAKDHKVLSIVSIVLEAVMGIELMTVILFFIGAKDAKNIVAAPFESVFEKENTEGSAVGGSSET